MMAGIASQGFRASSMLWTVVAQTTSKVRDVGFGWMPRRQQTMSRQRQTTGSIQHNCTHRKHQFCFRRFCIEPRGSFAKTTVLGPRSHELGFVRFCAPVYAPRERIRRPLLAKRARTYVYPRPNSRSGASRPIFSI